MNKPRFTPAERVERDRESDRRYYNNFRDI